MKLRVWFCAMASIVLGFLIFPIKGADSSVLQMGINTKQKTTSIIENAPISPSGSLSICSQHAPKCPLNQAAWPGEVGGWQYTAKKWTWVPGTPNTFNRLVIWEYSQPYSGPNQDYLGQREDHYADQSDPTQPPITYDWERYLPVGNDFKLMQLGSLTENTSYVIGDTDCSSGIYYPVVDHLTPFAYTTMYSTRWGECKGGGYVAADLNELWGEPLSQKRQELCDNSFNGVPIDLSPVGNTICKISPFVGVVYQRYLYGPKEPTGEVNAGCEAVLYAWGYSQPISPFSGQDYQTWFRNGELRFTRWYNLTNQIEPGNIPAPDENAWWTPRCNAAWTAEGNWLYNGVFRTGQTIYQDQPYMPSTTVNEVTTEGGRVSLDGIGTTLDFSLATFTDTVRIVEFEPAKTDLPLLEGKILVGPAYRIFAETKDGTGILQPALPFTISVHYSDSQLNSINEEDLVLYSWDGHHWIKEPSSSVNIQENVVNATTTHFSLWALMADGKHIYFPMLR